MEDVIDVWLNPLKEEVEVYDGTILNCMKDEGGGCVGDVATVVLHHYLKVGQITQKTTEKTSN